MPKAAGSFNNAVLSSRKFMGLQGLDYNIFIFYHS